MGVREAAWTRLRRGKLPRVLVTYLAAAWLVLQVIALLRQELQLPTWTTPLAIVVLGLGFVVVAATAWLQGDPSTAARVASDEIPGAWEIDLEDARASVAHGRLPHPTWARVAIAGVLALLVLGGVTTAAVLLRRGAGTGSAPSEEGRAAPGVAVLPFQVQGAELDAWKEGLVDLFATDLDGVAGLRAIDSRTVMARWRETVAAGTGPPVEDALRVAKEAGARYALLGTAVSGPPGLRLVVDVYDVDTATKLGQSRAEGPIDSIFGLVDRASIDVLRAVFGGAERLPEVNLSRVTTTSLPALKAYLEGESAFLRSDFSGALPAYERAIAADSTFALALYRTALSYGWKETIASDLGQEYTERAARNAQRLPEREASLVQGSLLLNRGSIEAVDVLRETTRRYPDDAEAWYLLGDALYHLGSQALEPESQAQRAFERAIRLDPSFTPAYIHLTQLAFHVDPDSARAAGLIRRYARLVPASAWQGTSQLALQLGFGTDEVRKRALAVADTLPRDVLRRVAIYLNHPRFYRERVAMLERASAAVDARPEEAIVLFDAFVDAGRVREAARLIESPSLPHELRLRGAYRLHSEDLALRGSLSEDLPGVDDRVATAGIGAFYVGAFAADRGAWDRFDRVLSRITARSDSLLASGDSTESARHRLAAVGLAGYALWKRDARHREALARFDEAAQIVAGPHPAGTRLPVEADIRWWAAQLLSELNRHQEAAVRFASFGTTPWAQARLAALYEEIGQSDKARVAWELVAIGWRDADAELRPRVIEARAAAQRLSAIAPR